MGHHGKDLGTMIQVHAADSMSRGGRPDLLAKVQFFVSLDQNLYKGSKCFIISVVALNLTLVHYD